jgi:hypothetical protein
MSHQAGAGPESPGQHLTVADRDAALDDDRIEAGRGRFVLRQHGDGCFSRKAAVSGALPRAAASRRRQQSVAWPLWTELRGTALISGGATRVLLDSPRCESAAVTSRT